MKQLLQALGDYSHRGLIEKGTFLRRTAYILRWLMTFFACWLFYGVIMLSMLAALFLSLNIIISICERL